ncbi:hypothetical protein BS78_09G085200 [Paspalum vaginatum]|nr:hypothetical protein BS78_09G085200 [Paspalum vaginatum]
MPAFLALTRPCPCSRPPYSTATLPPPARCEPLPPSLRATPTPVPHARPTAEPSPLPHTTSRPPRALRPRHLPSGGHPSSSHLCLPRADPSPPPAHGPSRPSGMRSRSCGLLIWSSLQRTCFC